MLSVIIEGCDRTFKTTTLRKIQALTQVPVYKAKDFSKLFTEQSKDNQSELFLNRLRFSTTTELDMQEQLGFDVIYDRHYPSEFVYSALYSRKTDMNLLREVDTRFKKMDAKIIIFRRHDYSGWQDDLDPDINLSRVDQLYTEFCSWTANSVTNIYVDEPRFSTVEARAEAIVKIIKP